MSGTLAGRTLLMSGGSRGIGLAIALQAARGGALIAKTSLEEAILEGFLAGRAEPTAQATR